MLGSFDYMHYRWKNYLVRWWGQFQNKDRERSKILEAVMDQYLWIQHAFFGLSVGNNDIIVLDRSPMVANMLNGWGLKWMAHLKKRFDLTSIHERHTRIREICKSKFGGTFCEPKKAWTLSEIKSYIALILVCLWFPFETLLCLCAFQFFFHGFWFFVSFNDD